MSFIVNQHHNTSMNDELYKKYLHNTLTVEELRRFREQLQPRLMTT